MPCANGKAAMLGAPWASSIKRLDIDETLLLAASARTAARCENERLWAQTRTSTNAAVCHECATCRPSAPSLHRRLDNGSGSGTRSLVFRPNRILGCLQSCPKTICSFFLPANRPVCTEYTCTASPRRTTEAVSTPGATGKGVGWWWRGVCERCAPLPCVMVLWSHVNLMGNCIKVTCGQV